MKPPSWSPDSMADAAVQQLDKNADGLLDKQELAAAPGLQYALTQPDVDQNKDGKFSRDEIAARLEGYVRSRVAFRPLQIEVLYAGQPLADAKVRLVPEAFLGGVIPPASATTGVDGRAAVASEGQPEFVRIGMYRVEITSDKVKLPASFNTQSTLGLEVSPYTDPRLSGGLARFNLRRS